MKANKYVLAASVILVALPTIASARSPKMSDADIEWYATGIAYKQCAISKAARFESSGESPQDIAVAALTACKAIREHLLEQIQSRIKHDHPNFSPQDQFRVAKIAIEGTDTDRINDAKLAVIQARSRKH